MHTPDAETEGVNPLPPPDPVFQPNQCRGARPRYPVERYIPGTAGMEQAHQLLFGMAKSAVSCAESKRDYSLVYSYLTDPEFGIVDAMIPHMQTHLAHMFKANKSDPDSPGISEAMRGPHRDAFLEAMREEIRALECHDTWTVTRRTALPEGANVLPGTWVFKIK